MGLFRTRKFWKEEQKAYEECKKLLEIFDMGEYEQTKAKKTCLTVSSVSLKLQELSHQTPRF